MLAKYWKKIGIIILVIACIINVGYKIIKSTPIKKELNSITNILEKNDFYSEEDKNYNLLYEQIQDESLESTND